jgi:hypothetical protein
MGWRGFPKEEQPSRKERQRDIAPSEFSAFGLVIDWACPSAAFMLRLGNGMNTVNTVNPQGRGKQ